MRSCLKERRKGRKEARKGGREKGRNGGRDGERERKKENRNMFLVVMIYVSTHLLYSTCFKDATVLVSSGYYTKMA